MSANRNVAIICRNTITREGLCRILDETRFNVLQAADSPAQLTRADSPELPAGTLVLIDDGTCQCDAATVKDLHSAHPGIRPVVLTESFDYSAMIEALRSGAFGYIVKEISCEPLVNTLELVAHGEKVLPSQLADVLQTRPALGAVADVADVQAATNLSQREVEILEWLIMGCPNKVISRHMDISEATVKVHVKAILRKLNVKNRTQAAIWAANNGLRGRSFDEASTPALPLGTKAPAPVATEALVAADAIKWPTASAGLTVPA
ncbi:response regulator transcription factor [Aurantiacibacter spongiae]|uniref:DNA-binding response regulator n=1 Tax=Aurantiacibacter spongiae TaxID=2488860 RepID=A0A3N5DK91_9SPHN|nr:response regulator transcription factor [Aurantiacibacter spongiae]RPF71175.1 DNA-binding response regulator [Aurantiacibacter spongiae]